MKWKRPHSTFNDFNPVNLFPLIIVDNIPNFVAWFNNYIKTIDFINKKK